MKTRLLGTKTGLRISELALGTARLGTSAQGLEAKTEARAVLDAFSEAGGTFIDTSSGYQAGHAEEMLGDFLAEAGRERFVISSKYSLTPKRQNAHTIAIGNHRGALLREIEGSLRRLRTDRIDLYFAHFDDGVTPIDEIMRGLDDAARAGKIVHVGLSNFPGWRLASGAMLADLRGWTPLASLQLEYNLLQREAERELLPFARARGLGVMGYSPLAGGALTKLVRSESSEKTAVALREIALELSCEAATIALAWVSSKTLVPMIGAKNLPQLEANLAATRIELTAARVARLDDASTPSLGPLHDLLKQTWSAMGIADRTSGAVL